MPGNLPERGAGIAPASTRNGVAALAAAMAASMLLAQAWTMAASGSGDSDRPSLMAMIKSLPGQIRRADPAAPDVVGGLYGGYSEANNSDVHLQQPNGTDMTLKDVRWDNEIKEMPPYHGFRGTWWLPAGRSLGGMVDLLYVKVVADRERIVKQSGTRDGAPVPDEEPLGATFRRLEFTDGLNLLTFNAVYRFPFPGRIRPYFGFGAGASLPHAEVRRTGAPVRTFEFQLAGYAVQAFAGLEFRVANRGSLFAEYRASYATNDVTLVDGGSLKTNLFVNHVSAGVLGHLKPQVAAAP